MGYLYFFVVFFLLAGTSCLALSDENDCELRDGSILRDGQRTNSTCAPCFCRYGMLQCVSIMCASPNCIDSTLVPGQCCPSCPNGPNCALPGGGTLSAGRSKVLSSGEICSCPRRFTGPYMANCRFPANSVNFL